MTKVPIMSDVTGQQIEQQLRRGTADLVGMLGEINTNLGGIPGVFIADATVTRDAEGAYSGLSLVTPFNDITAACLAGKVVVLRVGDNVNSTSISYFARLTRASGLGANIVTLAFECSGDSNPTGKTGAYTLTYVASANWLQFVVQPFGTAASEVVCSITVGGKKYDTVSDALVALAAFHQ